MAQPKPRRALAACQLPWLLTIIKQRNKTEPSSCGDRKMMLALSIFASVYFFNGLFIVLLLRRKERLSMVQSFGWLFFWPVVLWSIAVKRKASSNAGKTRLHGTST
jgi:hypothetical protein